VDLVAKNLNEYSLIAIDEIGPMELALPAIRDFINRALTLNKDVLAVVHRKVRLKGDYVFVVTPENRDEIPKKVVELFIARPL
jgi:nucleoside-triphosphatase